MTDPELLAKKLAFVETCVADLRRLARPEALRDDIREERFVAYTLQIAIQAALDAASHIVSSERLGEPATNRALFDLLERDGWISPETRTVMHEVAGFRNIVVHGYQEIDARVLEDILAHRLDDLIAFCAAVRNRLGGVIGR